MKKIKQLLWDIRALFGAQEIVAIGLTIITIMFPSAYIGTIGLWAFCIWLMYNVYKERGCQVRFIENSKLPNLFAIIYVYVSMKWQRLASLILMEPKSMAADFVYEESEGTCYAYDTENYSYPLSRDNTNILFGLSDKNGTRYEAIGFSDKHTMNSSLVQQGYIKERLSNETNRLLGALIPYEITDDIFEPYDTHTRNYTGVIKSRHPILKSSGLTILCKYTICLNSWSYSKIMLPSQCKNPAPFKYWLKIHNNI